ncbi:superoxide dismutase [Cu-Zn] [Plutella xylostella]|uniref:superoxide dismutase [Cu-Zn] n=1 Tax=Plutella xylostella TaxID=51655 RepID=UPI002032D445|nr:superoxide dismutase [Cu-Zn] [Plutella xylostella]
MHSSNKLSYLQHDYDNICKTNCKQTYLKTKTVSDYLFQTHDANMTRRIVIILISLEIILSGVTAESRKAIAHFKSANVSGSIQFAETDDGIQVTGTIVGLGAGKYGFHIHELGDVSSCVAAGSHFNPQGLNHGGPENEERHVGDLGNIEFTADGVAVVNVSDKVISLRGANNILGRTLMLHEGEDDLGMGGDEGSLTTGNAGGRVACGVIGVSAPLEAWANSGASKTFVFVEFIFTAVSASVVYLIAY